MLDFTRHRYAHEVMALEERLILGGWGYMAIHEELKRSFPTMKVPEPSTITKHITDMKHRGEISRGRTAANARPRRKMQNGHHTAPVPAPETPPQIVGASEETMIAIIRAAMTMTEKRPQMLEALARLQGTIDVLQNEIRTLAEILSAE